MILRVLMTLSVLTICAFIAGCSEGGSDDPLAKERDTSNVQPQPAPGSGGTEGSRGTSGAPGGG